MYHPAMTCACIAENVSSYISYRVEGFTPCACLDYMIYTSFCILHTPCACTYDNVLASQDVFIASFTPCACLDYMIYTSFCILHTPCACTYDNVLASQDVFIAMHISSTTQLDRSRSPTMPCILLVSISCVLFLRAF